tara:strand:- start:17464 stop:17988 length:525 start_codon:yes stop_codon:yes gene_type:complete
LGLLPNATTLVLGGARSGKSAFAERLIEDADLRPVYIATGRAFDGEMKERIRHHQDRRGGAWKTVEAPLELIEALASEAGSDCALLVDCLTLWLTNLMMDDRDIDAESRALVRHLKESEGTVVLVSNEVGMGIVPENRMAREFRDYAGRLHQMIAASADEVYLVAAGLPLRMKG